MDEIKNYQADLKFEHELINRRLSWLLTSQSILFASLAFVLGKDLLTSYKKPILLGVSVLGVAISCSILLGVVMGLIAKFTLHKDINNHAKILNHQQLGVRTWITRIAIVPDILIPTAFIAIWIYLWIYLRICQ